MTASCSTCAEVMEWEGTDCGVRDWKVQEKGQVVILTRLHGAERIRVWFSIEREDLEYEDEEDDEDEDDEGDGDGDEDEDDQDDDDGGDEDEDDEEDTPFVTCRISFFKPENGAILVTASVSEEDSFDVRAIAHSRNARIAMEHTAEVDWQCRRLYFGKPEDLGVSRQAFDSYLLSRGIDKELASYVMRYAEEKEKKEETEWLQNIENFIRN